MADEEPPKDVVGPETSIVPAPKTGEFDAAGEQDEPVFPQTGQDQGPRFAASVATAGGPSLKIGMMLPPDAATTLVQRQPEKVIALAKQVDDHAFALADKKEANRHAEACKEQDQAHLEELAEVQDRPHQRYTQIAMVVLALVGLTILLLFGWLTGQFELVGAWIEKFFFLIAGVLGGYGWKAYKDAND